MYKMRTKLYVQLENNDAAQCALPTSLKLLNTKDIFNIWQGCITAFSTFEVDDNFVFNRILQNT